MEKNKTPKEDTATLIVLLVFSVVCLVLNVLFSGNGITMGFLGLSVLLMLSQLKKMKLKL